MRRRTRLAVAGTAAAAGVVAPVVAPASWPPAATARAIAAVPEPASLVLLGAGLLGIAVVGYLRRRRRRVETPPASRR